MPINFMIDVDGYLFLDERMTMELEIIYKQSPQKKNVF